MHELVKHCESNDVPFYLENPQMSKLWMHPIIRKWASHKASHKVEFDYCQFETSWNKSTTIMSVGNIKFHTGKMKKCKVTWRGKESICSRTGKAHETLSGFINGAEKGQYKTNKACPYPAGFCKYVADLISQPSIHYNKKPKLGENPRGELAMVAGPKVSMDSPLADHYITHLPKHPGCKACMNCKVQRKHCRDHNKSRQRKMVDVTKVDKPYADDEIEKHDAPKVFGDLATSDSIFAIKRSSTSTARHGDTTSLVVRDKATGWIASYPSKKKSAEEIKEAVNDFKGADTIKRWYSDGAPELHAVCRDLGIRHDISDPHRSETNGQIERTNRTVIEGARCLLFQSGMPYKYWKLAIKCFCNNYNYTHIDQKKGTVAYVERHNHKFQGKALPYGCKIRYLPSAEREVEKREKLDPSLRDGIFVGYRCHTGGKWTEQYQIIDAEAYSLIPVGSGRTAYVHSVSEIYVPGSAGDDQEKHPTLPVADGLPSEAVAPTDEATPEEPVSTVEDLQTDLAETPSVLL